MEEEDPYAAVRPQRLKNPFRIVGWAMVMRGFVLVIFGFYAITSVATALRMGRYEVVATLLAFGFGFILWGARGVARGVAIGLRYGVRPSAPADLADRIDPHTGQAIGYGRHAYDLSGLRYLFLRKELPHKSNDDLIDQLLSILGRAGQPLHPLKRDLIIDVLRGGIASIALLAAFVAAFGFVQFDPAMQHQQTLMNLVFLLAFLFVLRYWGSTNEARAVQRSLSLPHLLLQMAIVTLVAVVLPILLGRFVPIATLFARVDVPSPFGLLAALVALGSLAGILILTIASIQSKRPVYSGQPVLTISEMAPVEAYGRLLPKDLLNAFSRFIGSSRSLSLDDRVYAFSETAGHGHEDQPSDHAEYIAESAPLLRADLLLGGAIRNTMIVTAVLGELLILLCAFILFTTMTGYTILVRQMVIDISGGNYSAVVAVIAHPLAISALFVTLLTRFGVLFREIGLCFLGEVVFQSFMVGISISSSILPGRPEVAGRSDGLHFFDAGRTSILRIRIQSARLQTMTMVSRGGGADSLGGPRYMVAAEREDRLMNALGQVAYRYIEERTNAAATRVRSESVEMKDASQSLVDSSSRGSLLGNDPRARLGQYDLGGSGYEPSRRLTDDTGRSE